MNDIQVNFWVNHKKVGDVKLPPETTVLNVLMSAAEQGLISDVVEMMSWKVRVNGSAKEMTDMVRDTDLVDVFQ